jgi:hypothetical protein
VYRQEAVAVPVAALVRRAGHSEAETNVLAEIGKLLWEEFAETTCSVRSPSAGASAGPGGFSSNTIAAVQRSARSGAMKSSSLLRHSRRRRSSFPLNTQVSRQPVPCAGERRTSRLCMSAR